MEDTASPSEPGKGEVRSLSPGRRRLFRLVMLLLVFVAAETATRLTSPRFPRHFEIMRDALLGRPIANDLKCVGQPYLTYSLAPGHTDHQGIRQHNDQGYRGRAVAIEPTPGTVRILCLGGSTTYGWTVERPSEAYPARLEERLKSDPLPGWDDAEVINAGLPWGTSAEMLTHYHFKFHYYRPDLVILEAGGNDANAMEQASYQPDYSHFRRNPPMPRPLPPHTRWILRSRLASVVAIFLLHGADFATDFSVAVSGDDPPPARWFPDDVDRIPSFLSGRAPRDEIAFVRNMRSLIHECLDDGARVLLVPFRAAPDGFPEPFRELLRFNEDLLKEMGSRYGLEVVPFPTETISIENWVDECHLNAGGELEKAAHVEPFARRALAAVPRASRGSEPGTASPARER